jgi:methylated-DNA-[protein]-cysteine S-methyltransferase
MIRYALFDTSVGWAAIAWTEEGALAGVHLPERDGDIARQGIQRRFPGAVESPVPAGYIATVEGIRALLRGEKVSLSDAPLDLSRVPEFNAKVYALTRQIPVGETRTYGEIATQLGDKLLARDVGAALGKNPWPIIVPCHRVTAAGGKLGGFSARGGERTKMRLLAIEGARAAAQGELFGKR